MGAEGRLAKVDGEDAGANASRDSRWGTVARLLVLFVLAATGLGGLYNAVTEWPEAVTGLQHLVSAGELAYGVTGVLAALAVLRRAAWGRGVLPAWVASFTLAGALAPMAYGGPNVSAWSAVASGAVTLMVAVLTWRGGRGELRAR